MEANDMQIGGDHYKADYQHWDWAHDINLHYYLAAATKYVTRWQKKNGAQDLRKALHFINKATERNVYPKTNDEDLKKTSEFIKQLDEFSSEVVDLIIDGLYDTASIMLSAKISELELQEKK